MYPLAQRTSTKCTSAISAILGVTSFAYILTPEIADRKSACKCLRTVKHKNPLVLTNNKIVQLVFGTISYLATSRCISPDSRGRTNMLVITTTVGMVHRVHGHTTYTWPAVTLSLVLVVGSASLQERLVDTSTAGNNS